MARQYGVLGKSPNYVSESDLLMVSGNGPKIYRTEDPVEAESQAREWLNTFQDKDMVCSVVPLIDDEPGKPVKSFYYDGFSSRTVKS